MNWTKKFINRGEAGGAMRMMMMRREEGVMRRGMAA